MELSANVEITDKGVEEVASRRYKLSIKKRSVLIQLSKPKTVQALLEKIVYPPDEVAEALRDLATDGFVTLTEAEEKASTSQLPDYEITHPSAFRFVIKERSEEPKSQEASAPAAPQGDEPTVVQVNAFRFVVK